ncbi:uncharacterized protein MONOS_5928 [Monocercomonoides exilis]|uniref:uncharacterized protein n=1 Tax=Monocercomonoides exilis TaxID=2049356 RepID=UPI003559C7D2|nr:hypothetical protein MONOS_5928 [Monocercomonoides exilis]|eukprot:MONOS_5928.1-p1 / transcript=MONOS_5928.1 / gene=MONOS_5928 / organism=Monocercomonoides_exilis_PA203 / gene_product=unspecified product / transcript_product=unspecified product / location=Mono_scaffold00179:14123-14548(-) / protein_length=142 / sequence_SO=supercontig / SO=protein_coding / is_pseudo=false
MTASVPVFFQEEATKQTEAHLVIGMETRNDENVLTSRWTASAVEVEEDDDSHLELVLHSFLQMQGKSTMLLLMELGQYLECTKAMVIVPDLKSEHKADKFAAVLASHGFQRAKDAEKTPTTLYMLYNYPLATSSALSTASS